MPTYVYKFVETDETIEVQQSFSDDTLSEYAHPETGALMSVKKVFQPVGVTFKGSGFFKNDNRGKQSTTTPAGSASSDGGSSDSSKSNDSASSSSSTTSSETTTPKSDKKSESVPKKTPVASASKSSD